MGLLANDTRSIERFVGDRRDAPSKLFDADSSGLPDAASYRNSIMMTADTNELMLSDGVTWKTVISGGGAFVTVAALLADNSPAKGQGTLWAAGDYLYIEAGSLAINNDVVTAGGVKLYVIPFNGTISPTQFGAPSIDDDPEADAGPYIRQAVAYCGETTGIYVVDFPFRHRVRSFDPSVSNRTCIAVENPGISFTARGQNGTNETILSTLNWSEDYTGAKVDSFIEMNAGALANRDFTVRVDSSDTDVQFETVVRLSYTGFASRHCYDNIHISIGNQIANYGIHGQVWGTTIDEAIVQGAKLDNISITSSTSMNLNNVYSVSAGRHSFDVSGWYGEMTGCSSDSQGGFAYKLGGRSWTLTQCGCEGGVQALYSDATVVTVDGGYYDLAHDGDNNTADYPIVINGGSLTLTGQYHQQTFGGLIVNVESGNFVCGDGSINHSQITGKGILNGVPVVPLDGSADGDAINFNVRASKFSDYAGPIGQHFSFGFGGVTGVWSGTNPYGLDAFVLPTVHNGFGYLCTVAGTSGGSEPAWPTVADDTVVDGGATWKAVLWDTNACGPIQGFAGTGSIAITPVYGTQYGMASATDPIEIKHNAVPIIFKGVPFDFDFNDTSKSGIFIQNSPLVVLDGCTITAHSPMGAIFDTVDQNHANGAACRLIVKSNCKIQGIEYLSGVHNDGGGVNFLRSVNWLPDFVYGNVTGEFEAIPSTQCGSIPVDTFWDAGISILRAGATPNDYIGDVCIRSGWSAAAWDGATGYALDDTVVPSTDNGYFYICTTAGTTDSAEPTWPTGVGDTVSDGTVVWTRRETSAAFEPYGHIGSGGSSGYGDVVGPGSSTNNHVAFFNGTSGKLIKDSGLTLSGSNTGDQTSVSGNAGTATALATGRTLGITGDLTWTSPSFNGTSNVTAAGTIANSAVSLAKMADVATATVFYRKTAGTGAPEVQTLATLKTDLGLTGTNSGDQTITLTGDVAGSGTGSFAATLATVNSNVGSFGSTTKSAIVTVNAKGLVTAASESTITPAVGSITGLGTGIATALGNNTDSAGAPVLFNGDAGTPSAIVLTNATGAPTWNQNTTGSAAKWTTARNLAGNSVDGSANVAFANKFIVQGTSDSGLSAAQFLGSLGTGIVKNTTSTGVLSIAVAGDFPTLNQDTTGSAAKLTTGRTIAMTGDVTWNSGSFDGSGNVTAAGTIANSAVTLAKIANAAANSKLVGSGATGSGSPYSEITLGTGLTMTGTTLSSSAGLSDTDYGDITVSGSGTVMTIDNNAVTLAKIAHAAANSKLLGSGAAGSGANYAELTLGSGLSMSGTTLSVIGGGGGDVVGPASATDNAIVRFDGTTGKLVQSSGVTIDDGDSVTFSQRVNGASLYLTAAGSTSDPQLLLNGTTNNWIEFGGVGFADPSFTTRSLGTKIVLYPNVGGATVDFAIGMGTNALWHSVDSASRNFEWWAATTKVMTLTGGGNLSTTGTFQGTTITATTAFSGPINGTVGAGTPNTGAFTTLSATGQVTFTGVTGLAGAIGAGIADYFTSTISLDASSNYEIECHAYFLKTTAGTLTWTWTFSSAPTMATSRYQGTPVTGFTTSVITGAEITGQATQEASTTLVHAATASLTSAVDHSFMFRVRVRTNGATTIQLRATEGAGTITPKAGSYMRATKVL